MTREPAQARRRRPLPRLGGRSVLTGGLVALWLAVTGAWWECTSLQAEAGRGSAPGRLVEVAGLQMHLLAKGEGAGPTVVLESGASGTHATWREVQDRLATRGRVIAYDRAGLGLSETRAGARDATAIACELRQMLARTAESPPYLLVGHSIGGLFVMRFAQLYPDQVAGMVLVDSSHPEQTARDPEMRAYVAAERRRLRAASLQARLGARRLGSWLADTLGSGRPEPLNARQLMAAARELDAWDATSLPLRSARFGHTPLVVLSASEPHTPMWNTFRGLHLDLASRSSRGEHRTLTGAAHDSILSEPRYAQEVVSAISELMRGPADR